MYSVNDVTYREPYQYEKKEERGAAEEGRGSQITRSDQSQDIIQQLQSEAQSIKNTFDRKKQKNLYDATMDLMAIAGTEKEASLRVIQTRLLFKARMLKSSGAQSGEIKTAVTKIKKVIAKAKSKIKKLQKEAQIEKKQENARKSKQRRLEQELKRELAIRRKVRKNKERKDVEESRMGMGANYGGPAAEEVRLGQELNSISTGQAAGADTSADILSEIDVAVTAETGISAEAAAAETAAIDISI